ncbi:MAG: flagellar biosynthesis anti-sigma factor FlgM [Candidatus Binatia bacterium]|nr:flagellar biosynthesis anti-sigma factor FlgM [Candidatus Binatia bacterium]
MKITNSELLHTNLSQLITGDKNVSPVADRGEKEITRSGEAIRVTISSEARHLQRVVELARQGDAMRAERVHTIKEQILQGTYQVEAVEVAKGILRSEIAELLGHR